MTTKKVGLIRVISEVDPEKLRLHALLMTKVYPALDVRTRTIEGFPDGIYNHELVRTSIPAILKEAAALAPHVDALAVSCTEDPGVNELRKRYQIPVIGAGSALAWACRALGKKVGVLTITGKLPSPLQTILADHSAIWRRIANVETTEDLQDSRESIIEATTIMIEHGCEVIALGCTGLSTVGAAEFHAKRFAVPVLDPVVVMGAMLSALS